MNYENLEGLAQALFEESGDALFLLDPETDQLLDANSTAQRLTGLALRELLRLPLDQLLHYGGPSGLLRMRQAARKSGVFQAQDGYFLCTAQAEVFIPVNLTISRLHLRPKTLALLTARDAREQQSAHSQVQQAEQELRRLLAAVPDCLWGAETDAKGRWTYRYISPAAEQVTGQPADIFMGGLHRWWSVVHPEDQPRWEKALARLRGGHPTQEKYRIVWPDGSCRWVRETVRVAPGGGGGRSLRFYGVVTDITEYRQAAENSRAGEERLRALLDGSPVLAFLKDAEGRFLYANRPLAALSGKPPSELVGHADGELFPSDIVCLLRHDAAALADERLVESRANVLAPDGGLHRWLVFQYPVAGAAGQRLLGGVAVDVTERDCRIQAPSEG